jgi:hypothetical protein
MQISLATTQIPAPSPKMKGKIVDVLEKGYKLGDKIIRFPKVVIGSNADRCGRHEWVCAFIRKKLR